MCIVIGSPAKQGVGVRIAPGAPYSDVISKGWAEMLNPFLLPAWFPPVPIAALRPQNSEPARAKVSRSVTI